MPTGTKKLPKLQQTPQGHTLPTTTPVAGGNPSLRNPLAPYLHWLGDPEDRYGTLKSPRDVPIATLLKMMYDPVVALASSFVGAILVNAEFVIECRDVEKRHFFEEMFQAVRFEFVLQSLPSLLLGYQALIKTYEFADPLLYPSWKSSVSPYVIAGFEQVHPLNASPRFEDGHFDGIAIAGSSAPVSAFYSLWITYGKHLSFGDYAGTGRLRNAYPAWWRKHFGLDLYSVFMQRNIQPTPLVRHPPGKTDEGVPYQQYAKQVAEAHFAGAPILLPSDTYITENPDGTETMTSIQKWMIDYIRSDGDVDQFHRVTGAENKEIMMGLLVPWQALDQAQMSSLGGKSTTEELGDVARDGLVNAAREQDYHINKYLFEPLDRLNFPVGSPPVRMRTMGIRPRDQKNLSDIIKLIGTQDGVAQTIFELLNLPQAMIQLGLPLKEGVTDTTTVVTPAAPVTPTPSVTPPSVPVVEAERPEQFSINPKMERHESHVAEFHRDFLRALVSQKRPMPDDSAFGEDE